MSNVTNSLSKEKIRKLLIAVGSGPLEDSSRIKASEYDWNEPHYFDRKQLSKLDDFTKKVAREMTFTFVKFCHSEFDVEVTSITQHFAAELVDQTLESKQNDYYLAFGTSQDNSCGLISIPTDTAVNWATQLLGDPESEETTDSGRDLSQLEESLLLDLLSALIGAFSDKTWDIHPSKTLVRRLFPLEFKGTEELCKVSFNVKKVSQEKSFGAYVLILSNRLKPIVGKDDLAAGGFSAEDISKAILGRMQLMPVCVTAQLASTVLTLEEIMNLEVGDVLLLDKKIEDPVDLIVNDRTAFRGRPAKSTGKNAIVITELSYDPV